MEGKYVISINMRKNGNGEPCEITLYAGVLFNKLYKTNDPCWKYTIAESICFNTIEEAKEWYEKAKEGLLNEYCVSKYDFDLSELCIRKIVCEKVESL